MYISFGWSKWSWEEGKKMHFIVLLGSLWKNGTNGEITTIGFIYERKILVRVRLKQGQKEI